MGRDYWLGTGKGVRGDGGGGGGKGCSNPSVANGCMSSVFRFFDFHHFQLCYHLNHQQHGNPEHLDSHFSTSQSLKGLEAPRNSFESSEDASLQEPAPSIAKPASEHLTIPKISVKTTRRSSKTNSLLSSEELSEDSLSSPGNRTPSLVARLMGLDLLPEASSPATSASSTRLQHNQPSRRQKKNSGTQSLPDSPRISLARWSDVDLHHRLSLQVNNNKDSNGADEVLCKRREIIKSLVENSEAEGWSPGHYAKQIVKQVKESVGRSRRVGLAEITNTSVRGRATTEQRRDEHLLPEAKLKTPSPSSTALSQKKNTQKTATNFRSEDDAENQPPTTSSNTPKQLPVSPSTSSIIPKKRESLKSFSSKPKTTANEKTAQKVKCRKAVEDKFKFTTSSKSPAATGSSKNKKETEPLFIRPPQSPSSKANQHHNKSPFNSKKTPLSTEQFNIPTSATRTGLHQTNQVVVSDKQKGHQLQLEKQINFTEAKNQTVGRHEIQYVSKILKCMGIGNHTRLSTISNWSSTSHPLNPSIFNLLEPISSSSNSFPQCDRRLIFQLTDEILADILQPSLRTGLIRVMHMNGDQLVKLLTSKMESFPLSNCQVLHDVDELVGSDYNRVGWWSALEDEKGSVVREVEREILDCLLSETTAFLNGFCS